MPETFAKSDYGPHFVWGISTASFQTEGAHDKDGKGHSIWDVFSTQKGTIANNHTAKIACDFYHKYEEDIRLLKAMNIPNFRFSLSWSRIMPKGTGKINKRGVSFYNKVIDCCLQHGITPWVTLYHWDLPHALELKGGWTNREILEWFSGYAEVCATLFGDRVKHWMVMNEPMVFTGGGYFLGVHAPGKKGMRNFLPAVHHAQLCQAIGGKVLRNRVVGASIGTTYSCSFIQPKNTNNRHQKAAIRIDALLNRMFLEPVLGLGYPVGDLPVLKRLQPYIHPTDMRDSCFDFDFIGIQNYTREIVRHSWLVPYVGARLIPAPQRGVDTTLMDWEVYPPSIYEMIKKYNGYKNMPRLLITENGAAFPDRVHKGRVDDAPRTAYLQEHLAQVLRAKQEGLSVDGYFVWTFTDNFEWAEGYHPRFGLVHVDFDTQKRIVKQSGQWYADFLGQ